MRNRLGRLDRVITLLRCPGRRQPTPFSPETRVAFDSCRRLESPNDAVMGAGTKGMRGKNGTNDGVATNKAVPFSSSTSIFRYQATKQPERSEQPGACNICPRCLHTIDSIHAANFSTKSSYCPFVRKDKGIRFAGNQDPWILASPKVSLRLFRQWPTVQSSLETSSLNRTRTHHEHECAHVLIARRWLSSRTQPLGCRLTFSARDDGVGLGHGSMMGVDRKPRENGTGNGTVYVRPTISVDTDFFFILTLVEG
ncbi:hypothetical protein K0M31_020283 [Melipona bicolor]|uniref:Uncharacterized protein n=1 Tax=Melipona bicolor TaxID=60889 RepID=A0AA40G285_9HYME|nr:hypothetical protein K0M31_020283 [Melipona bicolor]